MCREADPLLGAAIPVRFSDSLLSSEIEHVQPGSGGILLSSDFAVENSHEDFCRSADPHFVQVAADRVVVRIGRGDVNVQILVFRVRASGGIGLFLSILSPEFAVY